MDDLLLLGGGALITGGVAKLLYDLRKAKREKKPLSMLDCPLFHWTPKDGYRVRDLLNGGVLILGRAGSGKTSSSGMLLGRSIVSHPLSGGLILAAKPEDVAMWEAIFRIAGRRRDLIVFDPQNPWRFNFLAFVGRGETRNTVNFLMTLRETLQRGKNQGDNAQFWEEQESRTLYNAVAALQAAREPVSADGIHQFIMTAASSPAELATEEWQKKYASKILEKGHNARKTPIEAHDFKLAIDYWSLEWPNMDGKTRSNVLAGVMGMLHVYSTGIVREMVSGETNVSPADILAGKWVLVNFPPSNWGAIGLLVASGWKRLVEMAVLERHAGEQSPFVTLWCDEFSVFCNKFDAEFICQARSHRGALCVLLQSVASIYAAMPGEAGKHFADALLANFSYSIIHASDPVTAKWCVSKLGHERKLFGSGGMAPQRHENMLDELSGKSQGVSMSWSEQWHPVLDESQFMQGRTGGPDNNYLADAIVIKSGESFSDGRNYLYATFSQK